MLLIIPSADYHGDRKRVSASTIDKFIEDRRDARALFDGALVDEQTEEMLLGAYTDALVLEPLEVANRYILPPRRGIEGLAPDANKTVHRGTKEGKKIWAAFIEDVEARGLTVVDIEIDVRAQAMVAALKAHDEASHLLWSGGGVAQRVLHWTDEDTGADMRARLDRAFEADDVIVELKTDRDVRPYVEHNKWRWWERGYHRKAAIYLDGWHAVTGRNARLAFVFVENRLPPRPGDLPRVAVRWLEPDSPATEAGRIEYGEALRALLRCRETGDWREPWEKQATAFEVPGAVLKRHELGDDAPVTVGGERLF